MRRIVINMQNALFCNAIADTLRRSGNKLEPYTVVIPEGSGRLQVSHSVCTADGGYRLYSLETR